MESVEAVRSYYRAIDAGDYEALSSLLGPEFVHDRPDRTLEGRDRFVAFMRDQRPRTDTEHVVDRLYEPTDGDDETVARGRLRATDGEALFGFVDVFTVDDAIVHLRTYTD